MKIAPLETAVAEALKKGSNTRPKKSDDGCRPGEKYSKLALAPSTSQKREAVAEAMKNQTKKLQPFFGRGGDC